LFRLVRITSRELFPLVVGILTICLAFREEQIEFILSSLGSPTRKSPAFGYLEITKSALICNCWRKLRLAAIFWFGE
jgi:hypothetical protein